MRSAKRILIAAVATIAGVVSAGPAMAHINGNAMNIFAPASHTYGGTWPVTVTHSQFGNGTDCLTLTQGSGNGGSASLVAGGQKYPYGSFLVSKDILVVTITEPLYGQNGALCSSLTRTMAASARGSSKMTEAGRISTPVSWRSARRTAADAIANGQSSRYE